jgi:hypothetical protein
MILILRYILLMIFPLWLVLGYASIHNILKLSVAVNQELLFERSEFSGGIEGTGNIFGIGYVNKKNCNVCIGIERMQIVEYYADSLNNLKQGDKIKIWYNKEYNRAWLRINGRSKEDEINTIIQENGLYIAIYIVALSIFEYLYRKQKKLNSSSQIYSTLNK